MFIRLIANIKFEIKIIIERINQFFKQVYQSDCQDDLYIKKEIIKKIL